VNEDDRDHEIRAPAVQRSNEPPECDLVIEDLQTIPCFSGGWNIEEGEKNAGNNLESEHRERSAAKNVRPTRGLPRDSMLHDLADGGGKLKPLVEPGAHTLDQAHGGLPIVMFVRGTIFVRRATGAPVVGISPA